MVQLRIPISCLAILLAFAVACVSRTIKDGFTARTDIEEFSDDAVDFEAMMAVINEHKDKLGLKPEHRSPSAASSEKWNEARPGEIFPAVLDPVVLLHHQSILYFR